MQLLKFLHLSYCSIEIGMINYPYHLVLPIQKSVGKLSKKRIKVTKQNSNFMQIKEERVKQIIKTTEEDILYQSSVTNVTSLLANGINNHLLSFWTKVQMFYQYLCVKGNVSFTNVI